MTASPPQLPHNYPFDPTHGMDRAALLAIAPPRPPDDFATFWRARHRHARRLDPQPRLGAHTGEDADYSWHDLRYVSSDGVEIAGWLALPRHGDIARGAIIAHGYGGCAPPAAPPGLVGTVLLLPCLRGLGRSPLPGVSADPWRHVLHGIRRREDYILGGCVDDLWLAVSALLALFPQVTKHVACLGSSFGGGVAALAAPWDDRLTRLYLHVPSFGHQPLRLILPCVGSGEAVRRFQRDHPEVNVLETLAYYDAASAAGFLRIPTLVAPALFDPVVPPPGQFAIHNAIAPALRRLFVLEAGHFDDAGAAGRLERLQREVADFVMAA